MSLENAHILLDWYISPLIVGANISLRGDVIYHRNTLLEHGTVSSESREHSQHRILSAVRDILGRIDQKLLHNAEVRIIYAGDCYYAEPYHKTTRFDVPTIIDQIVQKESMDVHIRDIIASSSMKIFNQRKLTEFRVYDYTAKGFPYIINNAVHEYTVHGFVGWVDGSFHSKIERVLFLAGCVKNTFKVASASAYIPTLLQSTLSKTKTRASVFVYDIGMHCINLTTTEYDLPQASVRIPMGFANMYSQEFLASIVEHTLSLCVYPSGAIEAVVIVPDMYSDRVQKVMQKVFETVLYTNPLYQVGVSYVSLHIVSDMQPMFSASFI